MRYLKTLCVLACAGMLAGCGDRQLVLNVDVLSYLDPASTQFAVGPVPPLSPPLESGEVAMVEDSEVNLIEGTGSVASVRAVSISMTAVASTAGGSGADTVRLYMAEPGQEPTSTPPVVVLPIVFSAGRTDTVTVESEGDPRVADLFTGQRVVVTLTNSLSGPSAGEPLNAEVRLIGLDAVIVAGRKGL